ncbi:hypothetical protein [Patiriisocius sp. Uisw_017]|jgi:two-component system LytT family response regulator|uniref:hypothetical protein n=1 Tax=Patiriisocius sp. Uisw_017 TaxID=3230968 RepID=UPI0039EAD02A
MTSIDTVIVDDEPKAPTILKNKIERLCPELNIVATCQNAKKAMVFLDTAMPEISGFDLLENIESPIFKSFLLRLLMIMP